MKNSKRRGAAAIYIATINAAHVPLHTVKNSVKVMELAARCAKDGNLNTISDAVSGAVMARAALTAAGYNVRINLNSLEDKSAGEKMLTRTGRSGEAGRSDREGNPQDDGRARRTCVVRKS